MNLISLLFGHKPAVAHQSAAYRRESHYRPAQAAPEVWANFGVNVEEVSFAEFESTPDPKQQKSNY